MKGSKEHYLLGQHHIFRVVPLASYKMTPKQQLNGEKL